MLRTGTAVYPSAFDLTGRTALVTGGTDGIGRGVVESLIEAGARVAFTSRSQQACDTAAAELNPAAAGKALGVAADLTDPDAMDRAVATVLAAWSGIDILVGNAAVLGRHGPSREVTREDVDRIIGGNVHANLRLAHRLAPQMTERGGGSMVFITSISGLAPAPSMLAYAVSKAALAHTARSLAAEFAGDGIRVNCVAPGLIRTRASEPVWRDADRLKAFTEDIPIQRIGEPSDIGSAVVYLASKAGSYVTGTVIPVDGGRSELGFIVGGARMTDTLTKARPSAEV